jgi:hypothetical protein
LREKQQRREAMILALKQGKSLNEYNFKDKNVLIKFGVLSKERSLSLFS